MKKTNAKRYKVVFTNEATSSVTAPLLLYIYNPHVPAKSKRV